MNSNLLRLANILLSYKLPESMGVFSLLKVSGNFATEIEDAMEDKTDEIDVETFDYSVDLSNPLAEAIKEYAEKIVSFASKDDPNKPYEIYTKDITNLVNFAKGFDSNFNYWGNWRKGMDILPPFKFEDLVKKVSSGVFLNHPYEPDPLIYADFIKEIIKQYSDFYKMEYLNE